MGSDTGIYDPYYDDRQNLSDGQGLSESRGLSENQTDYSSNTFGNNQRKAYDRPRNPLTKPADLVPRPNINRARQTTDRARNDGNQVQIIGSSAAIQTVRDKIKHYGPDDAPVCILGESGVGKELVASAIHQAGKRSREAFFPINSGAITETLSTAELFGHEKGSFTGASATREGIFMHANHGSLYLDEIGEMPLSIQAKLLRVLDDGEVMRVGSRASERTDVRLITATNVDLKESVAKGEFRKDLYYRICVLPIYVPALRDRGDDAIEIAEYLIHTHKNENYANATLTPRACDRLRTHRFSGNVRELGTVIQRAVVNAHGGKICPEHLEFDEEYHDPTSGDAHSISDARQLAGMFVASRALCITDGNIKRAAELTGITRPSFYKILNALDGKDYAKQSEICLLYTSPSPRDS